jgi:hypothetical protein
MQVIIRQAKPKCIQHRIALLVEFNNHGEKHFSVVLLQPFSQKFRFEEREEWDGHEKKIFSPVRKTVRVASSRIETSDEIMTRQKVLNFYVFFGTNYLLFFCSSNK